LPLQFALNAAPSRGEMQLSLAETEKIVRARIWKVKSQDVV
jgi:hypothetical protein